MTIGPLLKSEIEATFEINRQRSSASELVFKCPTPGCNDASGNRSLNLKSGKTNCWRCNVGGDFIRWASKLGYHFNSAGESADMRTIEDLLGLKPEVKSILPVITETTLPPGFHYLADNPNSVYTRLIGKMAVRKNLTLEDMVEARCGFTRTCAPWEPFAIFPVFDMGVPVYYQGRTYAEEPGEKTKKFPSREEVKYGARYWIYNIDEVIKTKAKRLIVVESILNVLSLKRFMREHGITEAVPVAVFKHRVSPEQFFKMSRLPFVKELVLLFDHDAIKEAWKDADRLTNRFDVTVAEMPAGENNEKLDPNDDVALAWDTYLNRKPYMKAHALAATFNSLMAARSANTLAGMSFRS